MTRYTSRAKATTFVVVTPRDCKLTNGTAGDGTQSEKNSKRKVSDYHRSEEGLWRITMHHNYAFLWVLLLVQGNDIRFYRGKVQIKSEKLTPFGEIFSIMEKFDSMLSSLIDSTPDLRCKLFGYQYSEINTILYCAHANTSRGLMMQKRKMSYQTTTSIRKQVPICYLNNHL